MLVNEKATVISADVPATNGIIQHLGLGVGGSLEEVDKCWRLIWWSLQVVFFALSIYMCLVCLFPNSAFYMLVGVCYRLCAYRISMRRMQQKGSMYAIHLHICPYPQPCLSIAALHPFHCRSTLYSMTCYHRLGIFGKVDLEACFPFSIFWTWCFFPPVYILCYRWVWLLNRWLIGDSGWWFTILACMKQVTLGMKRTQPLPPTIVATKRFSLFRAKATCT